MYSLAANLPGGKMPNLFRIAAATAAAISILALTACGGASSTVQDPTENPLPTSGGLPHLGAPQPGVQMPLAPPVEIDFDSVDKSSSAVYSILFRDSVNQSSGPRWNISNFDGAKMWTLSN